jgi:hypothetical protein
MRELGYKTEFDENHLLQMFIVRIKWWVEFDINILI